MKTTGDISVIRPEDGRAIHWLGSRSIFLATSNDTASAFTIWTDEPRPGDGPPPHVHTRDEEFFYVLEGELTFWCAGQSFVGAAGAFVGLPKGLGHQFRNKSKDPARTLIVTVPGGIEGYFLSLGNPYSEPHDSTVPPNPKRMEELATRFGQTIAAPSLRHPIPEPSSVNLPLGMGRSPTFREPGQGDAFTLDGVLFTLKAVSPQTLGAYALVEIEVAPGAAFPAHRHARFAEGLYVLEGEISVQAAGPPLRAGVGSVVIIPPGAAHSLTNAGGKSARLLSMTTPAGIEDFYRSACRPVRDHPAHFTTEPPDRERLIDLASHFGIEFV